MSTMILRGSSALLVAVAIGACATDTGDSNSNAGPGAPEERIGMAQQRGSSNCQTLYRLAGGAVGSVVEDVGIVVTGLTAAPAYNYMYAGMVNAKLRRAALRFDLSLLTPPTPQAGIARATLTLYQSGSITRAGTVNAHLITSPWAEATTKPKQFTFDPSVLGTISVPLPNNGNKWGKGFVKLDLTDTVKAWVGQTLPNNGVLLEQDLGNTVGPLPYAAFRSSDNPTIPDTTHPALEVCYCVPGAQEDCNGLDDNCDGQIDEGFGTTTCGAGACQVTVNNCTNGAPVTCTPGTPAPEEKCDGVDDDCNGKVDDNPTDVGASCSTGNTSCPTGTTVCQAGQLLCQAPNGKTYFRDADGDTFGDPENSKMVCGSTGAPAGYVADNTDCDDTNAAVHPGVAETCDGKDNNCDGQVDNGVASTACTVPGEQGVCAAGTTACVNGAPVCNQTTQPSGETCDGFDNDCDGQVDNGVSGMGQACSTGKPGVCAAGTTACSSGAMTCQQTSSGSAENNTATCYDGVDNDCDGVSDGNDPGCNTATLCPKQNFFFDDGFEALTMTGSGNNPPGQSPWASTAVSYHVGWWAKPMDWTMSNIDVWKTTGYTPAVTGAIPWNSNAYTSSSSDKYAVHIAAGTSNSSSFIRQTFQNPLNGTTGYSRFNITMDIWTRWNQSCANDPAAFKMVNVVLYETTPPLDNPNPNYNCATVPGSNNKCVLQHKSSAAQWVNNGFVIGNTTYAPNQYTLSMEAISTTGSSGTGNAACGLFISAWRTVKCEMFP